MKFRSIELFRGIAALSVVAAHIISRFHEDPASPFRDWHGFWMPGTAGVQFFFVLSGFVMAVAHGTDFLPASGPRAATRPISSLTFLWRRICRIYPVYWVVLAFPIWFYWPVLTNQMLFAWATLLPIRMDNLIIVAWTLRLELTFYVMLALCLLPRIGRFVLIAWIAATLLRWMYLDEMPPTTIPHMIIWHLCSQFNFTFFAGLLAGWLLPRWPRARSLNWSLLAAAITWLLWRTATDDWGAAYGPVWVRPLYGAGYGTLLLTAATLERSGALRLGAFTARIAGAVSYPLYLSHVLVLSILESSIAIHALTVRLGPGPSMLLLLLCTVAFAWPLAMLVDQPMQQALRRLGQGRPRRGFAPG